MVNTFKAFFIFTYTEHTWKLFSLYMKILLNIDIQELLSTQADGINRFQ